MVSLVAKSVPMFYVANIDPSVAIIIIIVVYSQSLEKCPSVEQTPYNK